MTVQNIRFTALSILVVVLGVAALGGLSKANGEAKGATQGPWLIAEAGGKVFLWNSEDGTSYLFVEKADGGHAWSLIRTSDKAGHGVDKSPAAGDLVAALSDFTTEVVVDDQGEAAGLRLKEAFRDPGFGLFAGDVLLSMNGQKLTRLREAWDELDNYNRKSVTLVYTRNGIERTLEIRRIESPLDARRRKARDNIPTGLRIDDVEWVVIVADDERAGLKVKSVKDEGAFSVLQEGDVLKKLNGKAVTSVADLRRLVRAAVESKAKLKVSIVRDGKELELELKLPNE